MAVREEFGVAHHLLGLVLDEHLLEAGVALALLEHLEPRPAPGAVGTQRLDHAHHVAGERRRVGRQAAQLGGVDTVECRPAEDL